MFFPATFARSIVAQNVGTVESHVADYQRIIDNLQVVKVWACVQWKDSSVMLCSRSSGTEGQETDPCLSLSPH